MLINIRRTRAALGVCGAFRALSTSTTWTCNPSSFGLPDAHATMALHLFAMTSAYTLGGHMMPSSAIATRSPTSAVTMFDEGFLRDDAALEKINSVAFDEGLRAPGRAALEALDALMPSVESVDDLSVEDRGDRYIVSLSAPYVEPEDLEVDVEDGFLTVSGTTHHELWTGGRASAHFERSLRLPADADAEVYGLSHVGEDLTIELQKSRQSRRQSRQSRETTTFADIASEAEVLAQQSPRFKRWLKAQGYLQEDGGW